jgi:nitroimidazol reductase NimA-like FMN-containing flavoprotein (pyridoxamine 5'-phosphate oxidase superfamily)
MVTRPIEAPGADELVVLTVAECTQLLTMHYVGRAAFVADDVPVVLPVNYRLYRGDIVFRTALGSKVRAARSGATMSFEVDDYHTMSHGGWSVLATGPSSLVEDRTELAEIDTLPLRPWVASQRDTVIRISPRSVTGRRIRHSSPFSVA